MESLGTNKFARYKEFSEIDTMKKKYYILGM